MGTRNPKVDAYIAKSAHFAQPILEHLRSLVHNACPEVEETIKWGFPHFEYKGVLASMASFKAHCAFGFWKASLMEDAGKFLSPVGKTAMGHLGKITSMRDLPSNAVLTRYIREAMKLNEEGVKVPKKTATTDPKELVVPDDLLRALKTNRKALKTFEDFSYSNRKEYVEWITEAKTEATRERRLETAVEWMSEGKIRNWKYVKKK